MTRRARIFGALLVGIVAGFLAGLFGVGGGILIVPGLVALGMRQRLAHGTSLAAIVPIAAAGIAGFWLEGAVDWSAAGLLSVGAMAGAVAGTQLLQRLEGRALRLGFAALLLATAARLFLETGDRAGRGDLDVWLAAALIAVGLLAGLVAGLYGVGGGVVIVPVLVILFSVPDPVAKGTSLVVILPTAIVGTLRNLRHGNTDLGAAAATGLGGVVSAYLASRLAVSLDPRLSVVLFGALLVVVAIRLLMVEGRRTTLRREGRWPPEDETGVP
jgi:uncharacterized membrane protein YfcA